MLDIVPHTFPNNSFGINDDVGVINDMCSAFNAEAKGAHIALMRVVIDTKGGDRLVYPIPYVFVSGRSGECAITKWKTGKGQHLKAAIQQPRTKLLSGAPINSLVKGINDWV